MHNKITYDTITTIPLKITVVGSGYWGKNLVRNFHDIGALYAICDKDPQVRATFQELYPEISSTHSAILALLNFHGCETAKLI